jgi:hypothetical protein
MTGQDRAVEFRVDYSFDLASFRSIRILPPPRGLQTLIEEGGFQPVDLNAASESA